MCHDLFGYLGFALQWNGDLQSVAPSRITWLSADWNPALAALTSLMAIKSIPLRLILSRL